MPAPKGHPKWGGKQKGTKNKATLEKELELEAMRQIVLEHLRPMTEAQIAHCQGVAYMVLRHKDGTFTRATDVKQIDAACAAGAEAFQVFTQAPNTQAFTALLDRTFGKPAESLEVSGPDKGPLHIVVEKPW